MGTVFFILAAVLIWLALLSFFVFKIFRFFRKLSPGLDEKTLTSLLEGILEKEMLNSGSVEEIKNKIANIEKRDTLHIQRVGFVRFNPFEELGGDHSFSVALLDGTDTGIIITGLHTRERTRIYVKNIKKGLSEIELSREEKKALKVAQREN